jgi:hypothetical protein
MPASYEMRAGELAHLQAPGVRGDTKGGYDDLRLQESTSGAAVVPMPWLEEGLASAVALAWPEPNRFRFARGWRDTTLANDWALRPRVGELLEMSWADFGAATREDVRRVATSPTPCLRTGKGKPQELPTAHAARKEDIASGLREGFDAVAHG